MPDALEGLVYFPGAEHICSASYTLSHGVTPGVCVLEMLPQPNWTAAGGTLEFRCGAVRLAFPDCRVDFQSFSYSDQGWVTSLAIFDRRWKWAMAGPNGPLAGKYNWRGDDGRLDPDFKRTPQQLAELCLKALGEQGYDVSQLPNDSFPEVNWDNELPARALDELANRLGCRVVLGLNNRVRLCRTGIGAALPGPDDVAADSLTINPPEVPDSLMVVCAPTRFQADFVLEAVGLDTDEKIKRLADLSYAPRTNNQADWTKVSPLGFFSEIADGNARQYAKESVYRWYRIAWRNPDGSIPLEVPGYGKLKWKLQVLPLEDVQVDAQFTANSAPGAQNTGTFGVVQESLSAAVYGSYFSSTLAFVNTPNDTPYRDGFSIDREKGIVKFARPVYLRLDINDQNQGKPVPAELYLRCAFHVRDEKTWALHRYTRELDLGGRWGTGPVVIRAEEIGLTKVARYDDNGQVKKVETNEQDLQKEIDFRLRAALLHYQTPLPQEVTYNGLKALSPDGAIAQVSWTVSDTEGAMTRASRNSEFSTAVPSYEERRLYERMRGETLELMKEDIKRLKEQARRP